MASGVGHHLACGHCACYLAVALEIMDVQAILVGAALLVVGIVIGRRSRSSSVETLRVSLDEMRKEGAVLRDRVTRAEAESTRNSRGLDGLLALLPADVRDRLARDRNNG